MPTQQLHHFAETAEALLMMFAGWASRHWECLTATDFLSVEVHALRGLITHYILFFIDIPSRSVHVAGITPHPAVVG